MLRSALARLPFGSGDEAAEDGANEEAAASSESRSGFLPSRLDASVLFAHGADVEQRFERTDDDIADLEEEARRLDRER